MGLRGFGCALQSRSIRWHWEEGHINRSPSRCSTERFRVKGAAVSIYSLSVIVCFGAQCSGVQGSGHLSTCRCQLGVIWSIMMLKSNGTYWCFYHNNSLGMEVIQCLWYPNNVYYIISTRKKHWAYLCSLKFNQNSHHLYAIIQASLTHVDYVSYSLTPAEIHHRFRMSPLALTAICPSADLFPNILPLRWADPFFSRFVLKKFNELLLHDGTQGERDF